MYNFPGPNRLSSFLPPILVVVGVLFFGHFIWNLINKDDYDDDTVTVEFHCPTVLSMQENYPAFVITECQRLKNDR